MNFFIFWIIKPLSNILRMVVQDFFKLELSKVLTLILLTWRIWWALNNASKWQMGFNSAFKGLIYLFWFVIIICFIDILHKLV